MSRASEALLCGDPSPEINAVEAALIDLARAKDGRGLYVDLCDRSTQSSIKTALDDFCEMAIHGLHFGLDAEIAHYRNLELLSRAYRAHLEYQRAST